MSNLEKNQIQIGYIPLLDCVALLWAKHRGFFEDVGLHVELVHEASWASLRDRLAFGFLDAAHCLSAMLPAAAIGQDQLGIPLKIPLVLSQNRAFITLSQKLCFELGIQIDDAPLISAEKIVEAMSKDRHLRNTIKFAHVYKQSIHHYCLREWFALADENLAKNIQLQTLPPPYMVEALNNHHIDGFCVGEPWNTEAEVMGIGDKILSSQAIIPTVADKVLAVTDEWATSNPNTLKAMCNAIQKAQQELQKIDNFNEVWSLLIEFNIIRFECSETIHVQKYHAIQNIIRSFVGNDISPNPNDFKWLMSQMQKWDDVIFKENQIEEISHNCIISLIE